MRNAAPSIDPAAIHLPPTEPIDITELVTQAARPR
jgi:hypothetical protein